MTVDLSHIKKSTKAIVAFFLFNLTASQIGGARDWAISNVLPRLVHHPALSGAVISLFGMALALHNPATQIYLRDLWNQMQQDKPAEPGAVVNGAEVVQKTE